MCKGIIVIFLFSFPLLPNIEMKINNHSNLTFLNASLESPNSFLLKKKWEWKQNIHSHSLFLHTKYSIKILWKGIAHLLIKITSPKEI